MIKVDHFFACNHKDVLDLCVARLKATIEIVQTTEYTRPLDTHPRGCPTIHLSKSNYCKYLSLLVLHRRDSPSFKLRQALARAGEAE